MNQNNLTELNYEEIRKSKPGTKVWFQMPLIDEWREAEIASIHVQSQPEETMSLAFVDSQMSYNLRPNSPYTGLYRHHV